MNVLLDTNVVLDVLLERKPFADAAAAIWEACDEGRAFGFITASSLTDIFYIVRRHAGLQKARTSVALCLQAFHVCTVEQATLNDALNLPGEDFEDNVQIACAQRYNLDAIVTRDKEGFSAAQICIFSPDEMKQRLA